MKEITIKLYEFSELSEQAKERARNNNRERYGDTSWIYDEAHESIKKFDAIFGTDSGSRSWLDIDLSNIDDNILDLEGERLQRYIWNNFKKDLWKGKYYSVKTGDHQIFHKRVKSQVFGNGNIHNAYHSAITLDNCCVLTGVCYDDDLLKPIYDFLNARPEGNILTTNFRDLLEDCYSALKKSLEDESDYMQTDEYLDEAIECNDHQFLEDGAEYIGKVA